MESRIAVTSDFAVPRFFYEQGKEILFLQLHGLSDASQTAYAWVVYICTIYTDMTTLLSLAISKTKITPLKQSTISCLELCSAHLLNNLIAYVTISRQIDSASIYAWSDSSIALGWLNILPFRFKVFVVNKVADTVDLVPPSKWYHVPTKDNPADLASRGAIPKELLQLSIWWHGPELNGFLSHKTTGHPEIPGENTSIYQISRRYLFFRSQSISQGIHVISS